MEIIIDKTLSRRYLTKLIFSAYGFIIGIPILFTLLGIHSSDGLSETLKIILKPSIVLFLIVQTIGQLLYCYLIGPVSFRLIKNYSFLIIGILTILISNFIVFIISITFFSVDFRMIVAIIPSLISGVIIGRQIKDKINIPRSINS